MIIKKKSMITGQEHEMDLPITQDQIDEWKKGRMVQDAFPQLNADQREFLISGITPEEWNKFMKEE